MAFLSAELERVTRERNETVEGRKTAEELIESMRKDYEEKVGGLLFREDVISFGFRLLVSVSSV